MMNRYGIRAVAIAPSLFSTAMGDNIANKARVRLLQDTLFPPRFGEANEFAHLVLAIVENPMLNASTRRLDGGSRMAKL